MPVNDVFIGSEALRQGKLSPFQLRTRFHAIFPDVYVAQCTPLRYEHAQKPRGCGRVDAVSWPDLPSCAAQLVVDRRRRGGRVDLAQPALARRRDYAQSQGRRRRGHLGCGSAGDHTCAHRVRSGATTIPWRCGGAARRTDARQTFLRRRRAADRRAATGHSRPAATKSGLRGSIPGAASPKETWLRLLLVDGGLPTPETQIPVVANYRTIAYWTWDGSDSRSPWNTTATNTGLTGASMSGVCGD